MGELDDIRKDFDLSSDNLDDIRKDFESSQSAAEVAAERTRKSIKRTDVGTAKDIFLKGVPTGVGDVGLSVLYGINKIAGTEDEQKKYDEFLKKRSEEFEQNATPGMRVGRVMGQVGATAPLTPEIKAINTLKPLSQMVYKGATAGGIFGAATTAANPNQSALENTLEGAGVGAVAGPIGNIVGTGATKLGNAVREGVETSIAARSAGVNPGAAKYTLDRLTAAGLTPAQIRTELARLGPKATLADIDPALLTEAGGIAGIGDTPTSIMKNRFQARADTHNLETQHIINSNLGGNPDLEILKEQIKDSAQKAVSPDYKIAYSQSGLDVQPIIDNINKKLENAVGPKAAALKEIKSYFYKDAKDAQGNPIKILKHDVEGLHEIRTQLDTRINDKNPINSYDKNALNAVKDIRAGVDEQLKSIPEMKAADEKFAERMDVLNGIDIGKNFDKRNINYTEFAKEFNNANKEKQNVIREGIKGRLYDLLESATRGEMSEAKRLFGQSSANRAKFKLAFGSNADEVLDALEKEGIFQSSEKAILNRSHTAEGQAVQQRLGLRSKPAGIGDMALGIGADIASGSSGALTTLAAIKHIGTGTKNRLYKYTHENRNAALADLFSQSGHELNSSVNTLERVSAVRNRIPTGNVSRRIRKTIGTLPVAIGEEINREAQ